MDGQTHLLTDIFPLMLLGRLGGVHLKMWGGQLWRAWSTNP